MSTLSDLAAAAQDLARLVRDMALDPADAIRLLTPLAACAADQAAAGDAIGRAMTAAQAASAALCRRAALAELGRAVAQAEPRSWDETVQLRDQVCALLDAEIIVAADAGEDRSYAALRGLRDAVARRLNAKAGGLPRLRTVEVPQAEPALVQAFRLYGDVTRADEVSAYAAAEDPNFIVGTFMVRGA
ncbi:hypothetical protein SAMN02745194_03139 [Roseomonas rosea]|uniref:Mu-like prophage DNA circulation protein n=1 Tax=Muricoccus roseus TaxID=198092 RepID=A0A1M6LDV4_9PROT|nr:hypothetical protein [Roseomonas rosea]SHJ69265.1 hypothetical protein SAMN02745194_03139 [Roseomonas rosea]